MTGDDFYRSIPLTEEEIEAALLEGKKKKFFHERNKEYWNGKESQMDRKSVHEVRLDKRKENKIAADGDSEPSSVGSVEP